MQTVKPRARYLPGPGGLLWAVKHPGTRVEMWCNLPHDGAVALLHKYVLPNQTEPR